MTSGQLPRVPSSEMTDAEIREEIALLHDEISRSQLVGIARLGELRCELATRVGWIKPTWAERIGYPDAAIDVRAGVVRR